MKEVSFKEILTIIHRTINLLDDRLLAHGEQVAYIMMNLLKARGIDNEKEILNLCTVSMFHDIGVHKVSELDDLLKSDSINPFNHAVYGAIFLKHFSPLSNLYSVVLGHHFSINYIIKKGLDYIPEEALLLGMADYISILMLNNKDFNDKEIRNISSIYTSKNATVFIEANNRYNIINKLKNDEYRSELYNFLDNKKISKKEVLEYARMLAFAIDFRSEFTVQHSIMVEAISYEIGKLLSLDKNTLSKLKFSGILHDVGKISIPVEILEKEGKLTDLEFEIMKEHTTVGYHILSGLHIDDIRDIATLHHEKLDGSGYPFGFKGDKISTEVRIVAIADILSALIGKRSYKEELDKNQVINILTNMSDNEKIDKNITLLVIENYEAILKRAYNKTRDIINTYTNMKEEYEEIIKKL